MTITVTGDFDGGNPKNAESIIQTGPHEFTIFPYSEDEDPNYKFRLEVKANNSTTHAEQICLRINWQDVSHQSFRDYVYIRHELDKNWTYVPGAVSGTCTMVKLQLKPGETYISMHPKYGYEDYLRLIHSLPKDSPLEKHLIGETPGGRELWLLRSENGTNQPRKSILLIARIHPYETAGSYCMEGIISHFTNKNSKSNIQNSKLKIGFSPYAIYLIPMANPDGVFNGLCKKTAPDGIDLSKQVSLSDRSSALLRKTIDTVCPDVYCELHNWMHKDIDGIYFLSWRHAKTLTKSIPSQKRYGKAWKVFLRRKIFPLKPVGFKAYCNEKFGSICATIEYPWFGRSLDDMKQLGIHTLTALTRI